MKTLLHNQQGTALVYIIAITAFCMAIFTMLGFRVYTHSMLAESCVNTLTAEATAEAGTRQYFVHVAAADPFLDPGALTTLPADTTVTVSPSLQLNNTDTLYTLTCVYTAADDSQTNSQLQFHGWKDPSTHIRTINNLQWLPPVHQ